MNPENFEFFEGTKTIKHDDGSLTHITYEHEPYMEPLTPKQTAVTIGALVGVTTLLLSAPYLMDRALEWSEHRAEVRKLKKAQKIKDLKDQTNN